MAWTIEAKRYPLPFGQGHLFIEIFDDAGNRVFQYNGLGTNPVTGKPDLAGPDSDFLRLYNEQDWGKAEYGPGHSAVLSGTENLTRGNYPAQYGGNVLFSGTQSQVQSALLALETFKTFINANSDHLSYSLQFPIPLADHIIAIRGFQEWRLLYRPF